MKEKYKELNNYLIGMNYFYFLMVISFLYFFIFDNDNLIAIILIIFLLRVFMDIMAMERVRRESK